jgi:hypothetical protein
VFIPLLVAACYCALRFLDAGRADGGSLRAGGWLVGAALLIASLVLVRTVAIALVPAFLVWVLAVAGGRWRRRLMLAGSAALVFAVVLWSYAAAQERATGFFGLSRFSGWPLYGRAAPFADCDRFTPPAGTASLCEATHPKNHGPSYYVWSPKSPAHRTFGFPPAHGSEVGRFARAAIFHQPDSYIYAVVRDTARYLVPGDVGGGGSKSLQLNTRKRRIEADNMPPVDAYWHAPGVRTRAWLIDALELWRRAVRVHGLVIALASVLALAGVALAPSRRERAALALLVVFAIVLFVAPVATSVFTVRYGLPAALLLVTAAARGAELVTGRVRSARSN